MRLCVFRVGVGEPLTDRVVFLIEVESLFRLAELERHVAEPVEADAQAAL